MYSFKTEGIILSTKNYSEADRILIVFTRSYGKLALMAKGVRRLTSRKRGSLEVFNQIKFSVSQSHGMGLITEVEIINPHSPIRKNLKKITLAYYFSEVLIKTTRDGEKHEELYTYLISTLSHLEKAKELKKLRLEFIKNALVLLGFWPASQPLYEPDIVLENVTERRLTTPRIGKKLLE